MSWDQNTASTTCPSTIKLAVWSPCDRFIAITWGCPTMVDVLDSVTLQRLQTLESPQDISTECTALVFSPDSRILSGVSRWDRNLPVVSWDLQTGGVASVVRWEAPTQRVVGREGPMRRDVRWGGPMARGFGRREGSVQRVAGVSSITYSANGRMVGVFCWYRGGTGITILIFDVASGVCVHSYSINDGIPLSKDTWTYGGSLRFATADAMSITIWEVGFTSGAALRQVETLHAPDLDPRKFHLTNTNGRVERVRFLTAPYRLALFSEGKVMVWDFRNSKRLLHHTDTRDSPKMSFSSDGRLFACSTAGSDVHLWKESPTGYILHGKLATNAGGPSPLLSRNGESIVVFGDRTIRLWRTKSFTAPPSSMFTRDPQRVENFILDFSPNGMLAVIARRGDSTATVLNLKSGDPLLTIDASTKIYGLGVIGDTAVVMGDWKAITWNLPAGEFVPDARVGPKESSRTIVFDSKYLFTLGVSISSDSHHIALTLHDDKTRNNFLCIYSASTGKALGLEVTRGHTPWFSPDGRDVWCANGSGEAEVWRVGGGQKVLERLEQTVDIEDPPEGYPWGSSLGYRVTDDWWILGPDRKRLLMLPPAWQSEAVRRIWKGQFLALIHGELPEPVVMELDP